jgi:hypothetical protein
MSKNHVEEIECVRCGLTRHTIRGSFKAFWEKKDYNVSAGATYDLMECNGCQRGTLRETSWFSEDPGEYSVTYWPPRKDRSPLRKPRNFKRLGYGGTVDSVYRQTITAFNNGLSTLAGAGIRLLIEGVCIKQKILKGRVYTDQGKLVRKRDTGKIILKKNLEGKINGLLMKGFISKNQAKVLHQLRKLGNDATHALDQPPLKLIEECIDTIEHLLMQIYDQPELLKKLMGRKKPGDKASSNLPIRIQKACRIRDKSSVATASRNLR